LNLEYSQRFLKILHFLSQIVVFFLKSNISKNYNIVSAKAAKALWYCCTTPNSLDPVGAWRDFNVQFPVTIVVSEYILTLDWTEKQIALQKLFRL